MNKKWALKWLHFSPARLILLKGLVFTQTGNFNLPRWTDPKESNCSLYKGDNEMSITFAQLP